MPTSENQIANAWLETPTRGVIELSRDWRGRQIPPVNLGPEGPKFATFTKLPDFCFGVESGYFVNRKGEIFFFIKANQVEEFANEALYLAGDFNGWQNAVGNPAWQLVRGHLAGEDVFILPKQKAARFFAAEPMRFKFVTGRHQWLEVPLEAPNAVRDEQGNVNRLIEPDRTGQHLFQFTVAEPLELSRTWKLFFGDQESVVLRPGAFFFDLHSDIRLGAIVGPAATTFRLFAPRAKTVTLCLTDDLTRRNESHRYELKRREDHVWEITLSRNLHGWFYWYLVDGPQDRFGLFNPEQPVLDPYALAAVDRDGPGIILDPAWVGRADRTFKTPAWQDLVIVEAHVRDLADRAPVRVAADQRHGFSNLQKWVESPDFYLHHLGVNAVELQPVQEFDNKTREEYHWGYMTNNFFAPESSYSRDPEKASGIHELRSLVETFHKRGIAVLLDVVYNHVGEPAHLMFIDKLYYFEADNAGVLANWSGCGNDLRANASMAKRLIIDSLIHLIEVFGVDGFRVDLADLIGVEVLRDVERALKKVKPDVVLIAEPWSFRGHIAGALRDTGWASWNDGYRNFVRDYVRGGGAREGYEYFLKGSPWFYAKWPAQTVNYTESHDDKTWIDNITENPDGNGFNPTGNDRQRTHLMAAILCASIGIPMLAAGQDFLRSKQGVNNTYQRGDLNALDYRRIYRFPTTHAYFAAWIRFRLSEEGKHLRLFSRPSETFFHFAFAENSTAAATVYNADRSQGSTRLLFAVNPTKNDVIIPLDAGIVAGEWKQLADHEHFFTAQPNELKQPIEADLYLPPLSCGLWIEVG
ncbi:MAG TPA: alpha-amylase family glycosyl hydrolase [Opitutaceae bacterium]|nr:alpha-amylase family glycosyl hydrolase [Opitutaceae bacterium]